MASWPLTLMAVLVLCALADAQVKPTSCNDVRVKSKKTRDGLYQIYPTPGFSFRVYCRSMTTTSPKTYLNLVAGGNKNYATYYNVQGRGDTCADSRPITTYSFGGTTRYTRVLGTLSVQNQTVRGQVQTSIYFDVDTTNAVYSSSSTRNTINFGSAGDMYFKYRAPPCLRGNFRIDLTGTPFGVDRSTTWQWSGKMGNSANTPNRNNITFYSDQGPAQKVTGMCGGYPGSCSPYVSGKQNRVRFQLMGSCNPMNGSISPCTNGGTCMAVSLTSYRCECPYGWAGQRCQSPASYETVVQGPKSAARDDAQSKKACPSGSVLRGCACDKKGCDGSFIDNNNINCYAIDSGRDGGVMATATCAKWSPAYVKVSSTRFPTSGYNSLSPSYTCPPGYTLVGCSASSPWRYQNFGKGVLDNTTNRCSASCLTKRLPKGCFVTATCSFSLCNCQNGGSCNPYSGDCICAPGYVGSKCERFDYCDYQLKTTSNPVCKNGGICTAKPASIISTTGGSGAGKDCVFPFKWNGKQYSSCISDNTVGPPFACGIQHDGVNDYTVLGSYSPGYKLSLEAWFKPHIISGYRETVVGWFDSCRDVGIVINYGFIGMTYKPTSGCTQIFKSKSVATTNQWHHVAITMDGSFQYLYINGTQVGKQKIKPKFVPSARGLWAGSEAWCNGNCNNYEGQIKMVRIYNHVVSGSIFADEAKGKPYNITRNVLNNGLLQYFEFGKDAPLRTQCHGTEHNGKDWIISKDRTVTWGVHCNVRNFIVNAGVTLVVRWFAPYGNNTYQTMTGGLYGSFEVFAKNIYVYGIVSAWGAGYPGGPRPPNTRNTGFQGFGHQGKGQSNTGRRGGAGGGGYGDPRSRSYGKSGGGGGYGTYGGNGVLKRGGGGAGTGGATYGDQTLSTLFMGSGGGSGGNDNALHDNPKGGYGGRGGGAIRLDAREVLLVTGQVNAQGQPGQGDTQKKCSDCPGRKYCNWNNCAGSSKTVCWDYSGSGGGGSGGSIYLRGNTVSISKWKVLADGGRGGYGSNSCGGHGGVGRIRIDYAFLEGDSYPVAYKKHFNETFDNLAASELPKLKPQPMVYHGCFRDAGNRFFPYWMIKGNSPDRNLNTPEYCYKKCTDAGHKYAGVEYSFECFCGDVFNRYTETPANDCNRACSGDNTLMCGGSYRIDVWGPPLPGGATALRGAKQQCEPWCGVSNSSTPAFGICQGPNQITSFDTQCDCPAGVTGPTCDKECPTGKWGKGCANKCNCKYGICDAVDGSCTCAAGWRGTACNQPCATGTFGTACQDKCTCHLYCTPTRCDQNHSSTFEAESGALGPNKPAILTSLSTASGKAFLKVTHANSWSASNTLLIASYQFTVTIAQEYKLWLRVLSADSGSDSLYYNMDNDSGKTICWVGVNPSFRWRSCNGKRALTVGTHTLNIYNREQGLGIDKIFLGAMQAQSVCNQFNGSCTCNPGFSGATCTKVCSASTWGAGCSSKCLCQNDAICSPLDGSCTCTAGFAGAICDQKCGLAHLNGTYGVNCASKCKCQNGATCDFKTGACQCLPGFKGTYCDVPCASGTYGPLCTKRCACKYTTFCDPGNGTCHCPPGHTGSDCGQVCSAFKYGVNCAQTCSNCLPQYTTGCDHTTGACLCKIGLMGANCKTACPAKKWGTGCAKTCCCRSGSICNPASGACHCANGWQGQCCWTACAGNRWGPNCNGTCLCKNGGACNRFNGACNCKAGFKDKDCGTLCNATSTYGLGCKGKARCNTTGTAWIDTTNGKCNCKSGYKGLTCSTPCPQGQTGVQCLGSCGCQNGGLCHPSLGVCDCPAGFYGKKCDLKCGAGNFGYNCSQTCNCQNGAACDPADGSCRCTAGFTGSLCDAKCPQGTYGLKCAQTCQPCVFGDCDAQTGNCNCWDGYRGTNCSQTCILGFWGKACSQFCSCGPKSTCNVTNGQCSCTVLGKIGSNCDKNCSIGYFGAGCQSICPTCNPSNSLPGCDPATGVCLCKPGFTGPLCSQSCPLGSWGDGCSKSCSCGNQGACHPTLGTCVCAPGYTGATCNSKCPTGTYGQNCLQKCLCDSTRGSCNNVDGSCTCGPGFIGIYCEKTCPPSYYGLNCAKLCTSTCNLQYGVCDPVTGSCVCLPGYIGSDCRTPCVKGKWGPNCNESCSCLYGKCDHVNGQCKCDDGYTGLYCDKACQPINGTQYYGPKCSLKCQCQNSGSCDHVSGACACTPGYNGYNCEKTCDSNHFGHLCYQRCICKNGATCNPVNGFCQCAPGWAGLDCSQPCPSGTYGAHCANSCPICEHQTLAGTCDVLTGKCNCDPGWMGTNCSQACPDGYFGDCSFKCSCAGANSVCIKTNGTCLCGASHTYCKFGSCGSDGKCKCNAGYTGDDCRTPCQLGKYGVGCQMNCNCHTAAICNNVDGKCSCPGSVLQGTTPKQCNGRGSCSTSGECLCDPGYTGPSCNEFCPAGMYGLKCSSRCSACGNQMVCSPIDGTCVQHCSGLSGDFCLNGGSCNNQTGICNCTGTGYQGAHCKDGALDLQVQSLQIYKADAGDHVDATWEAPTNLADYQYLEPIYSLVLTDTYDPSEPYATYFTTTNTKRSVPVINNHMYTLDVIVKTSVGAGPAVRASFGAGLHCPLGDTSIQCRYHTCGKCSSYQVCYSKTNACTNKCNVQDPGYCKNSGTCNAKTGFCECAKDWGGLDCSVEANQVIIDPNGEKQTNTNNDGSTSANTGGNDNSSSGLSSGALIGIVLGVILIVAAISLLLGFMYIQQIKRRQHAEGGPIDPISIQADVKYDTSGEAVGFSNPVYASTKAPVKDNPMYESQEVLEKGDDTPAGP